jgi:transcriptional regulator with PAS, ATPase and Fis domain
MRIVAVGLDEGDPFGATLRAGAPGAEVVRACADDGDDRVDGADLIVLAPACVARDDVLALVQSIRRRCAHVAILAVGRDDRAALAVALLKAGASDYVVAGSDELPDVLSAFVAPTPPGPRGRSTTDHPIDGLVGRSRAMAEVRALVRVAAGSEAHVLVDGETGTGKEVVARAIHRLGPRAARPLVPINCAAIPETLAESELFGHARGAFTGAVQERPGALRLADGGTLFLDEIEDLSLALQAKLLRVVQDREVRPLGASSARRVDVRIVAASNRDLWQMVEAGRFRSDLYYRLRVLTIRLPPLRERRDDVPALIAHFVDAFNARHHTRFQPPPLHACRVLLEHTWPGNVRELENSLEAVLTMAHATGTDLAHGLRRDPPGGASFWADERTRLLRVLEANRWNRQRAAAALGISRVTLWRRMERHHIRDPLHPIAETA